MEEFSSIFWRWNFPAGMLMIQTVMCMSYGRKKLFFLKWIALLGVITVIALTMTHDWEWAGDQIKGLNILMNIPGRILIMVVIAIQMFVCYEIKLWNAVFLTTIAIMVHRIQFSVYKILEVFFIGSVVNKTPGLMSVLLETLIFIIFLLITAVFYNRKNKIFIDGFRNDKTVITISLIVLFISDFITLYQFANDSYVNFGMTLVASRLFDICFNLITLYMLYNLIVKRNLQLEQKKMEMLISQRKKQYAFSRDLIDSINIKSHDLKKQIRFLEKNDLSRKEMVDNLKDAVARYDTIIETENEALSTILSEKSLICHNNSINFLSVVDVGNIDFIKPLDIYSIMANLLDNAVEASLMVDVKDRSISLNIKRREKFISIHVENYFSGNVKMSEGEVITIKKDIENHGFGMKSIKQIIDCYDGNMTLDVNGNIFSVNILIPIP